MESSQPTGRLASEPTTRPVSGGEPSAPTPVARSGGPPGGPGRLILGRYRLEEQLGAGGFGVVWRAHDEHLERDVAVKAIPRATGAAAADRTAREARAAARLNHPGIVALYEMGSDTEAVYLVSELVPGSTFAVLRRGDALSDRDVGRIGSALADALVHAHDRGVIHRDVKPQNVIVLAEPAAGAGFAKLTDFGVAHLVGDDPLTRTGDVVGTLAYMAPEQAEGRAPTGACDVYSLALTLYEGLAGENPKRGHSPAETARLVGRRPPALRAYRRDLPSGLCGVLDACLDPRPERRPDLLELHAAVTAAVPVLDSHGGLVEPETLARFGLLRRDEGREEAGRRVARDERREPAHPPPQREPQPRVPARRHPPLPPHEPRHFPPPEPAAVPAPRDHRLGPSVARVAAGLAAAALVFAALELPAADPPVSPAPAAAAG
ncbi:MAG: serine/threonine protein kinase, partial [Actinomycetota bacterium]|nr:serine/threonine protein kinase [Actinomycetota bacterium]